MYDDLCLLWVRMGEPRRCWLRWHNYSDSVTSALESLRYDEDFLDVTLACDGHTVRAHKLVLSACSAYFRKVLKVGTLSCVYIA